MNEKINLENSSVWSFPMRGNWANHRGDYPGNFAPQVGRNLILRYSRVGDKVLDPMVGGGTSLIETSLLDRSGIGVDINPESIKRVEGLIKAIESKHTQKVLKGDARNLDFIEDSDIDLIILHPPYFNIVKYSKDEITEDLSSIDNLDNFYEEIEKVAKEMYRVLKKGKYCALLMGDKRKNGCIIPLSFKLMSIFLEVGFNLKEHVIKLQHNCRMTPYWSEQSEKHNFLLIAHENLFIFRK